jgi:hypothetical protein
VGLDSEPPAHPCLVCDVLRSEERRQRLLFGCDLEAIDVQREDANKEERYRLEQEGGTLSSRRFMVEKREAKRLEAGYFR